MATGISWCDTAHVGFLDTQTFKPEAEYDRGLLIVDQQHRERTHRAINAQTTTDEIPIVDPAAQTQLQAQPHRAKKRMSRVSRRKLVEASDELWRELIGVLVEGVLLPDGESWTDFWAERMDRFDDLRDGLRSINNLLGIEEPGVGFNVEEHDACTAKVLRHFPKAEGEICFLDALAKRAFRLTDRFDEKPLRSPELEAQDAHMANRFNFFLRWYSIAMSSLLVIADEEEPMVPRPLVVAPSTLARIFEMARFAALELNHAAIEGSSFRRREVEQTPVRRTEEISDDDLVDVEIAIRKLEATQGG
jgi:hypothetical protein